MNKFLIKIIAPIHHAINHILIKIWYDRSSNPERIRALKGIHAKDKRCFLVGNGPSLTAKDLNMLKNEITFASNKIYHVFDKTEFRPTYYIIGDGGFVSKDAENIMKVPSKATLVGLDYFLSYKNLYKKKADTIFFRIKTHLQKGTKKPIVKVRVDDYVNTGHTVLYAACEFAMYMGFKEIYLIGVDCNYKGISHFYSNDIENDMVFTSDPGIQQLIAFCELKKYADKNSIKIYNATRGGKLEIFPRMQLENLI